MQLQVMSISTEHGYMAILVTRIIFTIKVLRIASIVVGIIGYSAIWMWLINNRRNEKSELAWVLWKLFHAIVIALAFLWAWF